MIPVFVYLFDGRMNQVCLRILGSQAQALLAECWLVTVIVGCQDDVISRGERDAMVPLPDQILPAQILLVPNISDARIFERIDDLL